MSVNVCVKAVKIIEKQDGDVGRSILMGDKRRKRRRKEDESRKKWTVKLYHGFQIKGV